MYLAAKGMMMFISDISTDTLTHRARFPRSLSTFCKHWRHLMLYPDLTWVWRSWPGPGVGTGHPPPCVLVSSLCVIMCIVIVSPRSRINCSLQVPRNWLFLWPAPAAGPLPVPGAGLITVRGSQETSRGQKRGPGAVFPLLCDPGHHIM